MDPPVDDLHFVIREIDLAGPNAAMKWLNDGDSSLWPTGLPAEPSIRKTLA